MSVIAPGLTLSELGATLSANQNDYNPGMAGILKVNATVVVHVTGLATTSPGRWTIIAHDPASAAGWWLDANSASSLAANRFASVPSASFGATYKGAMYLYDPSGSIWRRVS